jgi:purine-binding chemotaxis protein CheW
MSAGFAQSPSTVVVFEVAGQLFGVRAEIVRELVRAAALTQAPQSHAAVLGLLNLRGQAVAVFDLRKWCGWPPAPLLPVDQFIVLQTGDRLIALRGEGAIDLASLQPSDIEPAADIVREWQAVASVARIADRLALLLEPEQLWSQMPPERLLSLPPLAKPALRPDAVSPPSQARTSAPTHPPRSADAEQEPA